MRGDRMEGHNEECRKRIGRMMEADGNTRTIGYDVRLGETVQRDSEEKNGRGGQAEQEYTIRRR